MTVRAASPEDLARIDELARIQDHREGTMDATGAPTHAIAVVNAGNVAVAGGWIDGVVGRWVAVRAFSQEISYAEELLAALLASAREKLISSEFGEWIRIERVLRPETEPLPVEATTLYEQHGFELKYVELEMARALDDIPAVCSVADVTFEQWTPERDAAIRDAYNDAFSTRGFEGYSADDWVFDSFSVQDEFLPDCSFLAISGDEIIGFSMCVDEAGEGWIDSAGVRPAWRGRGIADALLVRSMHSMREAGIKGVVLRVNEDNPRAIAVYDRLGFAVRRKHAVWQKAIAVQ